MNQLEFDDTELEDPTKEDTDFLRGVYWPHVLTAKAPPAGSEELLRRSYSALDFLELANHDAYELLIAHAEGCDNAEKARRIGKNRQSVPHELQLALECYSKYVSALADSEAKWPARQRGELKLLNGPVDPPIETSQPPRVVDERTPEADPDLDDGSCSCPDCRNDERPSDSSSTSWGWEDVDDTLDPRGRYAKRRTMERLDPGAKLFKGKTNTGKPEKRAVTEPSLREFSPHAADFMDAAMRSKQMRPKGGTLARWTVVRDDEIPEYDGDDEAE